MEFDFDDLTPQERPVRFRGQPYTLREATEADACAYRNAVLRSRKVDADGKLTHFDGLADAGPLLVALCLRDAAGAAVPVATVRAWPARVVKPLFDWVQRASGLREEEETEAALAGRLEEVQAKLAALRNGAGPEKNARAGATGTATSD
jgi:hypothetical protein